MVPTYFTGFNAQVISTAGLFDENFFSSNTSITTSNPRHAGGAAMRINPTGSGGGVDFSHTTPGNDWVTVFYVRFSSLPSGDCDIAWYGTTGATNAIGGVGFEQSTNQICAYTYDGTSHFLNAGGPTLTTGTYYRVECHVNAAANPWTIDIQVAAGDGIATPLTQSTLAATAALPSGKSVLGIANVGTTTDMNMTDWVYNFTGSDYPIGPVQVWGYSPNAVGTHNLDASTSVFFFKRVGSTDTALTTSETNSYQTIDDVPLNADTDTVKVTTSTAPGTPAFRSAGSWAFTANNVPASPSLSPGAPSGKAVGDLLILVSESRSNSATAATPSGWNIVSGFPVHSGTASGGTIYIWTRIADGSGSDTPSVAWSGLTTGTSGDATGAGILAYTAGSETSDATIVSQDLSGQGSTSSVTGITTATDNSLVIVAAMKLLESSGQTASITTYTERADNSTTSGTGHIIEVSEKIQTSHGASGSGTVTWSATTSARALIVAIALRPGTTTTQPANTEYAEYAFADETAIYPSPIAVSAIATVTQDSANTTGLITARVVDGSSTSDIYSNGTVNSTSRIYQKLLMTSPPSGGSWTTALLNGLKLRYGLTANATGTMRLESAMFEALFPVSRSLVYGRTQRNRTSLVIR